MLGTDKSLPLDCWRSAVGIQQSILNGLLIWWPFFSLRFSLLCFGNVDLTHTIDSVIDQTLASNIAPLITCSYLSNFDRWRRKGGMQSLTNLNSFCNNPPLALEPQTSITMLWNIMIIIVLLGLEGTVLNRSHSVGGSSQNWFTRHFQERDISLSLTSEITFCFVF